MASRRVTVEFLGDDKNLSKVARNIDSTTSKLGDRFKKVGKAAAIGLGVGVAAAGTALVAFGKSAVAEARDAQKVTAQTNAVIKSTGGAANISAEGVANLAEKLSLKAGVDDELIQSGSNVLLTFKNIRNEVGKGNDIFDQATGIALDMSTALGQDMKSSAILVGKALNDPIAGVSALTRVGVSFTDQQKKTIESLVEQGDTMKAQKLIMRELNSEFAGSAEAQATAGDKASVAWGNFQEFVGAKLLPVIDKLAVWFTVVAVPALVQFSNWFQREGMPVVKRFGAIVLEVFGAIVAWVRKNWPEISRVIKTVVTNIAEIVRGVVDLIRAYWKKWGEDILRIARIAWDFIYGTVKNALKVIQGVINVVTGLIKGDWSQVWKGIRQIFGGVWDQMKTALKTILKVFREIIRNAWDAIKDIFKAAGSKILDLLRWALGKVRDAIGWYLGKYRDAFKGAWDWVKDTTRRVWDGIRDVLGNAFGWVRDKIANAIQGWRNIIGRGWDGIKRIFGFLKDGVRAIPDAFRAARDGIGRIWQALKKTVGSPVYFVLKYVWNEGIANALEKIPGIGDWSVPVGKIPHWRKGGYTGPGAKDKVAGLVHAKEWVIPAEATEKIERTNPGFLDRLNKEGLPGHQGGGLVNPMKRVYVDGEPLTAVHAAQLLIAGQLMGARQYVMQGSWQPATSYSGTSHTGSGVADTSPGSFTAQWAHRRAGLASWARNIPGAHYAGSGAHLHGISPFSAPGNSQLAAYFAGGDGLGGSDYGPRPPVMPGLRDRLRRFGDLTTIGSGAQLGIDIGLFPALFSDLKGTGGAVLGAADAILEFRDMLLDVWDDIQGMKSRGGWWPTIAKAPGSSMDEVFGYGKDKIGDAGGWLRDKSTSLFGDAAVRAHNAWEGITDLNPFDNGGTLSPGWNTVYNGTGGPEPLVRMDQVRPRESETLVAELHVYLDGKQIENSQVRLKRLNGGKLAYL